MGIKVLHVTKLFDATLIFLLTFNYLMVSKTKFLSHKSKPDLFHINSCGEMCFVALNTEPQAGWNDNRTPGDPKGMNPPRDDREKWPDLRAKVGVKFGSLHLQRQSASNTQAALLAVQV